MKIEYTCPPCVECGVSEILLLDEEALIQYHYGMHIQNAFPDLTPDERELIISGTHPDCWDRLFADD